MTLLAGLATITGALASLLCAWIAVRARKPPASKWERRIVLDQNLVHSLEARNEDLGRGHRLGRCSISGDSNAMPSPRSDTLPDCG
jgi:hypothetical protein